MKEKFIASLKRAPKASHTIRVLAGGYLAYTAYQIFKELDKGQNDFLIIVFAIFFAIVGVILAGSSLYALSNYYYAENKTLDNDEEAEVAEDAEKNSDSE